MNQILLYGNKCSGLSDEGLGYNEHMKKQLLFMHGGEAFSSHEDYFRYLEGAIVEEPEYKNKSRWYYGLELQEALGKGWQVMRPDMPCKENAKYAEWKIWFEKYAAHLQDEAILCGHSLGAMFLARYLSECDPEEQWGFDPELVMLVAGAYQEGALEGEDDEGFFVQDKQGWERLRSYGKRIMLVHSKDDFVVPFENHEHAKQELPNAKEMVFGDRGHFLQETFDELIKNFDQRSI